MITDILGCMAIFALIIFLMLVSGLLDRPMNKIRRPYMTQNEINEYLAPYKDYMKHTCTCPKCYGRGRVPAKGWYFQYDEYKVFFEKAKASRRANKGIPVEILKAFDEDK